MPSKAERKTRSILPLIIAGVAALLLAGAVAIFAFSGPAPAPQTAAIGGPFTLTNGEGKTVTDRDFQGKFMLVYFGYTFCPTFARRR